MDLRSWDLRQCSIADPEAARLVAEVQQEYVVRYGSPDESPVETAEFDPPGGAFFVGSLDGVGVATGAWRRRPDLHLLGSDAVVEIKRMFVVAGYRRQGISRLMLAHLEETARAAGAEVMALETGLRQPEAIALYESVGYQAVTPYGHYRDSPMVRCMARSLRMPPPA